MFAVQGKLFLRSESKDIVKEFVLLTKRKGKKYENIRKLLITGVLPAD